MSPTSDFLNEVRLFGRRNDDELSSLLHGDPRGEEDRLVVHLAQAQRALLDGPSPAVARAHLAVMADTAHLIASQAETRPVRVRRWMNPGVTWANGIRRLRRIAVALAVTILAGMSSMVGLAYAGVRLPSPAIAIFHVLHVNLPNQDRVSNSDHGRSTNPSPRVHHVKPIVHAGGGECRSRHNRATGSSGLGGSPVNGHQRRSPHRSTNACGRSTGAKRPQGSTGSSRHRRHHVNAHGKGTHVPGKGRVGGAAHRGGPGRSTTPHLTGNSHVRASRRTLHHASSSHATGIGKSGRNSRR